MELTVVPNVENPKRLAWKICTTFSIPVVRCEASPGQKLHHAPCPQMSHQGVGFSPMIHPIRRSNSSHCCWQWLMFECCSIGQRKLDHQPSWITALWQWALWSWCNRWRGIAPSISGTSSETWKELTWKLKARTQWSLKGTLSPSHLN